ncbi:MAG: hypothetical protein HKO63_07675 [Acidimicrobiia bacterium]|nr:hypothetical protein [Acidimicrobiia bacterium]MBT8193664.1 hypothetical protein [Acidimicrobiia bacterium]MBT8247214.1 hypothetical protein [Acidimicrobiia bacterium]NNF87874.1 hypothetical protein [Acidimicrobiia bacterium]NNJ46250.1 hypothetical protein [Acidimicrobiia bacterium]
MTIEPLNRNDWPEIAEQFQQFFTGLGSVTVAEDRLVFDGTPVIATGLELRRDGTSASFMPLHGFEARWDRVRFDLAAKEISIEADGVRYLYRVPPALSQEKPQ